MTSRATAGNQWVFLGRHQRTIDVSARLVSDDLEMLRAAARVGLGIGALPSYLVADDLRDGSLVPVLPRERLPGFRAHAVLPSGRHVPRRVRVFVDFLAARLRGGARPGYGHRRLGPPYRPDTMTSAQSRPTVRPATVADAEAVAASTTTT